MRPVYEVKFDLREQLAGFSTTLYTRGGGLGASYNRLYPEVLDEKKTGKFTGEVNERVQKSFI